MSRLDEEDIRAIAQAVCDEMERRRVAAKKAEMAAEMERLRVAAEYRQRMDREVVPGLTPYRIDPKPQGPQG